WRRALRALPQRGWFGTSNRLRLWPPAHAPEPDAYQESSSQSSSVSSAINYRTRPKGYSRPCKLSTVALIRGSTTLVLRRSHYRFQSDGNRFALFAEREKPALSISALQKAYPPVGHAVFLPQ